MKVLFIHQSFPGQYRHIINELANDKDVNIIGLGINKLYEEIPSNVRYIRYPLDRGNTEGIDNWLLDIDSKLIRAKACAKAAYQLKKKGYVPDIICAHPGWGESLFIKDVWPDSPILCYQEFFYRARGFDFDFDSELQGTPDWEACASIRVKTANSLLNLESADWNITPTHFQRSSFPENKQDKISVIHDGINTDLIRRQKRSEKFKLHERCVLTQDMEIVTFVNRNIEPYRGCHSFIRAIPEILRRNEKAQIVIVGNEKGVSYGKAHYANCWRDEFLKEIDGRYEKDRLHFVGQIPYHKYLELLQFSSCHVYLTYPFVLSWSLLEAMAAGLPIVGSNTEPVKEVIRDKQNGYLVDFFSISEIAEKVSKVLNNKDLSNHLGQEASKLIIENYDIKVCVPKQISLIKLVADRALR